MPFRPPSLRGVTPQGRGRYPGYDVLDELKRQDDVTTGMILARLSPNDQLVFFTAAEQAVATPLVDQILGQDGEPKVPVLPMIDARLASGETDGYVYEGMPDDAEAWRRSLAALDADARERFGRGFGELDWADQGDLVAAVQQTEGAWHDLPASRVWSLWTRYACAEFYAHPWAWNEIGFGGPAYPRGYKSTGIDKRENWEVADAAPTDPVTAGQRIEQARAEHERNTRVRPGRQGPPEGNDPPVQGQDS
ncbi:gluconate 2-dehydrogenase subunit 3 family protein [Geodermatophilus sp. TF02-6]|uniref:gluconate 2-dehydrogenase subunit 3 family protein n=1 Tax=Geodermatophilus sp. TF02-6 TaxID=2250575 RepID=UPI000DE85291|nr:gluconate 2-dehydrogenase subunit 3 family protein [Geodermatophilus sp. TF02-6]RBY78880.1 gluconate 2-dehydrogenase subunit 3 family protein [Geodermatophilus sp. TF02-6]